jgi:hypothetical protein
MIDRLSSALGRIAPSPTLAMTNRVLAMRAEGIEVIGLSAGEPDFDTPDFVKEAAIEAIRDGHDQIYQCRRHPRAEGGDRSPSSSATMALTYSPKPDHGEFGRQAHAVQRILVATVDGRRGHHPRALLGQLSRHRSVRGRQTGVRDQRRPPSKALQDPARTTRSRDHAQDPLADPQLALQPDWRCL